MKKVFFLILLLVVLVACSQTPVTDAALPLQPLQPAINAVVSQPMNKTSESADVVIVPPPTPKQQFKNISSWFYFLDTSIRAYVPELTIASYDLVVIDPVFTRKTNEDFNAAVVVKEIKASKGSNVTNKIVLAYINIGQAESYRYYWNDWRVESPSFILDTDSHGWQEKYAIAYWDKGWKNIWLASHQGYDAQLKRIIDAGFDGVYIDGTEAYLDGDVIARAIAERKDPQSEMKKFVSEIKEYTTKLNPDFIIIAQNGVALTADASYAALLDGVAQEHVWFDGGPDGKPDGDCPLARMQSDVTTKAYRESLKNFCLDLYEDYANSTLHTSSEELLKNLIIARRQGLSIFTVDYATKQININKATQESLSYGFIPFVTVKNVDVVPRD